MTALGERTTSAAADAHPAAGQPPALARIPTGPAVPRGWYADPAGCHEYRFWDGVRWTPGVADNGFVREDPLPAAPCAPCAPPADERVRPPLRAAAIGVGGLVLGAVGAALVGLAFHRWAPQQKALGLALSEAWLWIGMVGAVVAVSRRYGSGSVRQDFGFRVRPVDAGWGLLLAVVTRVLATAIAIVVLLASGRHISGGGLAHGAGVAHDRNLLIVLCLLLVVGAPLVEELFFRGLILRSLQLRLNAGVAVVAQAVLFSACHSLTTSGIGLISELLSTLVFGVLAGAVVVRFRRLGSTIVAHALFNAVVAAALIVLST